jgi:uncharacterized protein YkwD
VPPVKWNNILETAAAQHTEDMYVNNYFSHIAPNGSSPIQRAQADGYTGMYMGENIATGYNTVAQVMNAWEKSEDHCKAMLDSTYVDLPPQDITPFGYRNLADNTLDRPLNLIQVIFINQMRN